MTGAFLSRRRADEFDAVVSAPTARRDSATESRYADLLEVVSSLRSVPDVTARPEFVADLRSQLVVEAARMARPVDDALRARLTPSKRSAVRERRAATLLGGLAIVAASGSMAMASQAALPGDVLYPVKRAIENAETNLQSDDAAKAETLRDHAERRLQEAQQLSTDGADAATVAATLHDFTAQSNQAAELALDDYETTGDQAPIGDLRSFTERSMTELAELGDVVPEDARAALIAAAQSVQQADSAAFQVCPTCGDGTVTELPEFATTPVSSLLRLGGNAESTVVPPGFLDEVQAMADRMPPARQEPADDRGGPDDTGVLPPVDETSDTEPVIDPRPTTTPLEDLGDRIKRDLPGDDVKVDLDDTVDDVVSGIGGLVDTITSDSSD
ncbi:DUF5667 domain-containing protein [Nocardioides antri]|uniref:DUF5667 domain-containing protein n=1 Tax=Nocardioides antri TaxID=2607659 RepID=A0A5B1M8M4_9ACTN|nr:DUF5667 domain-containing protein [Nocardioides antri]KAA1428329.1 hypothetical protein F0U47_05195 [Nocardioides antri]